MNRTLGQHIYDLRKQHKMTQKELASLLYVSDKAISRWEKDITKPDIQTLSEMANIFHITLDQLVNIEQPDTISELTNIDLTNITLDELTGKIDSFIKTNHKFPFKSDKRKPDYSFFDHLMRFGAPTEIKLDPSNKLTLLNIINSYVVQNRIKQELKAIQSNTTDKNTIKAINHILENATLSEKWKYFQNTINAMNNKEKYKLKWIREYKEGEKTTIAFGELLDSHPFFPLDFHRSLAHMSIKETTQYLKLQYPEHLEDWLEYQEFANEKIKEFFNDLYQQ